MVVDRSEVWLGSMNYTYSGVYDDNNVLIRVRSVDLAENYLAEFDEMFVDDRFGSEPGAKTPKPEVDIESTRLENLFAPEDHVGNHLVSILNKAQESIYFMAFSFTDDNLGESIRSRAKQGVEVTGVMDAGQIKSNIGTEYDPFKQDGLDVRQDGNAGQMHEKVMIIDARIVIVGSYNFTRSADTRNDENVVVIYNEAIAEEFEREFQRLLQEAHP